MEGIEIKSKMHDIEGSSPSNDVNGVLYSSESDRKRLINQQQRMCESMKESVLFDAIGRQFHFSVFANQFWAHIFMPAFFCLQNRHGQGLQKSLFASIGTIGFPCLFYIMLCSYGTLTTHDKQLVGYSLFWPFFSYVSHRAMIALKYATLSPTEYRRFTQCRDLKLSLSYLNQMMLFSGWLNFEANLICFELGAAAARIGERINEIHIIVRNENHSEDSKNQLLYWNAFLRGHREMNFTTKLAPEIRRLPSGDYAISVYDLALGILRYCNSHQTFFTTANRIALVIAMIMIAISLIPIAFRGNQHFDNPILAYTYIASSTIMNFGFGGLVFLFLSFVLFDVLRLQKMMAVLHSMIRISDVMFQFSVAPAPASEADAKYMMNFSDDAKVAAAAQVRAETDDAESRRQELIDVTAYHPLHPSLSLLRQRKNSSSHHKSVEGTNAAPVIKKSEQSEEEESKDAAPPKRLAELYNIPSSNTSSSSNKTTTSNHSQKMNIDIRGSTVLRDRSAVQGSSVMIPRVTFAYPENVLAWTFLRLTIQAFGDRFRFRTDIYAAFILLVMVLLMVMTLSFVTMADDRAAEFHRTYVIQAIVAVTLMVLFLVLISLVGALVNTDLNMQRCTLASHAMNARSKTVFFFDYQLTEDETFIKNTGEKCLQLQLEDSLMTESNGDMDMNWFMKGEDGGHDNGNYNNSSSKCVPKSLSVNLFAQRVRLIEAMMKILDVNNTLRPFKFLGMMATFPLTISIVTTAISFYSILVSFYFSTTNSSSGISSKSI